MKATVNWPTAIIIIVAIAAGATLAALGKEIPAWLAAAAVAAAGALPGLFAQGETK